jgi:hypothetical protein
MRGKSVLFVTLLCTHATAAEVNKDIKAAISAFRGCVSAAASAYAGSTCRAPDDIGSLALRDCQKLREDIRYDLLKHNYPSVEIKRSPTLMQRVLDAIDDIARGDATRAVVQGRTLGEGAKLQNCR